MIKRILNVILAVFILMAIFPVAVGATDIVVREIVSGLDYDDIGDFSEGLALVWKNGKYGFIDKTGKLVIPCVYENPYGYYNPSYYHDFSNGLVRVNINGKETYIDKSGRNIITIEYDDAGIFSDGMAWIRKDDKYGYIDNSGDLVIPIIYDCYFEDSIYAIIPDFSEDLAAVNIEGKCGFINKTGELVIPAIYDGNFWGGEWWNYIPKFNDGIVRVRKDGNAGCIDKTGKVIIPFEYYWLANGWTGYFREGLAVIDKYDENGERKPGLIDKNGNFVVPLGYYDMCSDFNGTLAYVEIYGQGGAYIDKNGKLVTPFEYYLDPWNRLWYDPSYEGMTIALKDGKYGFLDSKGNIAVPFVYDLVQPFSNGLAYVYSRESVSGYVDKTGKLIFPKEGGYTDMAQKFLDGLAWVCNGFEYGYINNSGELVVPCIYDYAHDFNEGLTIVKKDGKWAILEIVDYSPVDISPKTGDSLLVLLVFVFVVILVIKVKIKRCPE